MKKFLQLVLFRCIPSLISLRRLTKYIISRSVNTILLWLIYYFSWRQLYISLSKLTKLRQSLHELLLKSIGKLVNTNMMISLCLLFKILFVCISQGQTFVFKFLCSLTFTSFLRHFWYGFLLWLELRLKNIIIRTLSW